MHMMPMPLLRHLLPLALLAIALLSGCAQGAVQFAPTPLPPDRSPLLYTHPSGAFSISVPRDWVTQTTEDAVLASAAFSIPGQHSPALSVATVNLGADTPAGQLSDLVDAYQSLHRPDLTRYREQERRALGDGSWQVTGVRSLGGSIEQLNTFIQTADGLIAVAEVVVGSDTPRDAAEMAALQTAMNTLRLLPGSQLQPAPLAALGSVRSRSAAVQNVNAWRNAYGVFFITGEVANFSTQTLSDAVVRVSLRDAAGNVLSEAADGVMGHALPAGGFAPFSLRFGDGQPAAAQTYTVQLELPNAATPLTRPVYGRGSFVIEDESPRFTEENHLVISATLRSQADVTLTDLIALVTAFDLDGQVIAAWRVDLPGGPLAPGETRDIALRVTEIGGEPSNYILEVQGLGPDPAASNAAGG